MANIKIDEAYRVVSDRYNWALQALSKDGKWKSLSYHSSVKKVVIAYLDMSLRMSDAESIKDLLSIVRHCEERIEKMFNETGLE